MNSEKRIDLIGGEKGGKGKSKFCQTRIEYYLVKDILYHLIDADRSNPDVGLRYEPQNYLPLVEKLNLAIQQTKEENGGKRSQKYIRELKNQVKSQINSDFKQIYFSEKKEEEDLVNSIVDYALKAATLVNMPAQVAHLFDQWINKNRVLDFAASNGIKFVNWFLSDGGSDSLELFVESLEKYGHEIPHIFVKNHGICSEWEHLKAEEDFQKALLKFPVKLIDFPALSIRIRNQIDRKRLTFCQALESAELSLFDKHSVRVFLDGTFTQMEEAEKFIDNFESNSRKLIQVEGHERQARQEKQEVKPQVRGEIPAKTTEVENLDPEAIAF